MLPRLVHFHLTYTLTNDTALNVEFAFEPIYIRPPQRKALADAQTEQNVEKRNRTEWLNQLRGERLELLDRETARMASSLTSRIGDNPTAIANKRLAANFDLSTLNFIVDRPFLLPLESSQS